MDNFLINLISNSSITDMELSTIRNVCYAEQEAQALKLIVQDSRAPLSYLALIVIIFAGPLGDKFNKKKPFLLLPLVGELFSVFAYLITSIFKSTVPMQFHLYLETILNSLCGGFSLMLMGVFSILAATTSEEHRTFRFGAFSAFFSGAGIILAPLATYVFEYLGYVNMFLLCIFIHVFGIIFIIFFIDEYPLPTAAEDNRVAGKENPGYIENENNGSNLELKYTSKLENGSNINNDNKNETHKHFCRETMEMSISSFKIFFVHRILDKKIVLWLVIIGFSVFAFSNVDTLLLSSFGRLAWGWTTEFALYSSFNQAMSFIGTVIVTAVFVNMFKMSDPLLVIIAVFCRLISRILYSFFKNTNTIYLAGGIDMFNSAPVVAIRSVLSKIVEADELGRLYTVMSILETLVNPLATKVYVQILTETLQTAPQSFYFLTIGLLSLVIMLFIPTYVLVKKIFTKESIEETNPHYQNENGMEVSKL
ncbi:proton-coupled folate transporter-like [Culicoides brevitarsis]|uniref:proton-coupled folate transporter-like n=1 Tax=Culicoides brevitarsis TaxID=469753 RepID=UPI00307CA123